MFCHALRLKTMLGKKMSENYSLHGRFWIEGPDGTFLGHGRVVLLERIKQYGSITAAARSMEMSYRHAWKLVDSMNRQGSRPVVKKKAGGRGGGGAVLTETGERAIDCFWAAYRDLNSYLDKRSLELDL